MSMHNYISYFGDVIQFIYEEKDIAVRLG
jgi:hypothetical protein